MTGMQDEGYYEAPAAKYETPTPITMALAELGNRCKIKNGAYYIDNYPVTMQTLIEKANQQRKERGDKLIKLSKHQ